MTNEQIASIYLELQGMSVVIPHHPQMGFTFYADRVAEGRIAQDRLGDLIISVNKDTARVRVAIRTLKEIARLSGRTHEERIGEQLSQLANEADDLRFLAISLGVKAALVRQSIFDIRLAIQIMEAQVRLGEVAPKPVPHHISGPDTSESAMMVERFLESDRRTPTPPHKH